MLFQLIGSQQNLIVQIAALYDIHGNLPALQAVIAEIKDVDVILIGGDVVWGPWPRETLALLQSLPNARFILGNTDRDVFNRSPNGKQINDWCADQLTDAQLEFLRSWPATISMGGILFCHGSPANVDTDRITIATPAERISWSGVKERDGDRRSSGSHPCSVQTTNRWTDDCQSG